MRLAYVKGIANAQRIAREAILEVAHSVQPGDTERAVIARIETALRPANVHHWLHTPYAWWGARSRFDGFGVWECGALGTDRKLGPGEAFVLDVAPIIDGYPSDFAYSGVAPGGEATAHAALLSELATLKSEIVTWVKEAASGSMLCDRVRGHMLANGFDVVHTLYPAQVLGHTMEGFPNVFSQLPRIGCGFQLPLLLTYAKGLVMHHLVGEAYPFLNAGTPDKPQGLFAVEPHLGRGTFGAKFESILLVDGDETRWLDPELFGEVLG